MGIFNTIPWKTIASFMPTVMNLVRDVKGGDAGVAELRLKVERLEQQQKTLARYFQVLLVVSIVTLLFSLAALAVGIVYLVRG